MYIRVMDLFINDDSSINVPDFQYLIYNRHLVDHHGLCAGKGFYITGVKTENSGHMQPLVIYNLL